MSGSFSAPRSLTMRATSLRSFVLRSAIFAPDALWVPSVQVYNALGFQGGDTEVLGLLASISFGPGSGRSHSETCSGCIVSRAILPTIETPIYEALYASSQGVEQRSDHERGDDDGKLRLLLLAG